MSRIQGTKREAKLTPEELGRQFGRSEAEFNIALSWLQSQGFDVDRPNPSEGPRILPPEKGPAL